ncbi:hypothetical protein EYF80_042289 [Liparis tanakae]|uniref:Uncharacterized protein n=1 Tax=Liparis tanakae TaxID=230148 RepID=A0A4Z2G4L8_9TELE|nr:hypothetical protein EYF80_042289 [Liparis tanakae]
MLNTTSPRATMVANEDPGPLRSLHLTPSRSSAGFYREMWRREVTSSRIQSGLSHLIYTSTVVRACTGDPLHLLNRNSTQRLQASESRRSHEEQQQRHEGGRRESAGRTGPGGYRPGEDVRVFLQGDEEDTL